jgi:hypothetical protein
MFLDLKMLPSLAPVGQIHFAPKRHSDKSFRIHILNRLFVIVDWGDFPKQNWRWGRIV